MTTIRNLRKQSGTFFLQVHEGGLLLFWDGNWAGLVITNDHICGIVQPCRGGEIHAATRPF